MSNSLTTIKCKSIRYYWLDDSKLFPCLLIVLGYLYVSMMAGGWISQNNILYCWPIQIVYTFHVPLLFVFSCFIYQVTAKDEWSIKKHITNIKKKALTLGFLYVTFSIVTILLKKSFVTEANYAVHAFLKTLLVEPIAPYWYLYTLLLLFCLIPPITGGRKKEKLVNLVIISCFIKIIYVVWLTNKALPDLAVKVMACAIWFCMDMLITAFSFKKTKLADRLTIVVILITCILSYFIYAKLNTNAIIQFVFSTIFVLTITYLFQSKENYRTDGVVEHSVKYFMPVYVLHTIVAAGIRTVLLKLGIASGILHFVIGFGVSIFIPVIIYMVAENKWWLLFFFEPIKAIKLKNQNKVRGGM